MGERKGRGKRGKREEGKGGEGKGRKKGGERGGRKGAANPPPLLFEQIELSRTVSELLQLIVHIFDTLRF